MLTDSKIREIVADLFRNALSGFETIRVTEPDKALETEEFGDSPKVVKNTMTNHS